MDLRRVEHFIRVVGSKEDAIFQRRMRMLLRDKNRRMRDRFRGGGSSGGGRHGSRGGDPNKGRGATGPWRAAVPSAAYAASEHVVPVGHGLPEQAPGGGNLRPGVRERAAEMGRLPLPGPVRQPKDELPPPPGLMPAGLGPVPVSNKMAAVQLRERMRAGVCLCWSCLP